MYSLASYLDKLSWENGNKRIQESSEQYCEPQKALDYTAAIPVGRYLVPVSSLKDEEISTRLCLDASTGEQLSCRVYDLQVFQSKSTVLYTGIRGVHPYREVLVADGRAFVFSGRTYGDLHQYLRDKKRLTEVQAAPLFRQIVELVVDAHLHGLALRDIKLKKFVFEDPERTSLSLQYLDDARLMEPSGLFEDRHGCPAYVCPEMLQPGSYSGQAADLWSLGVILYTLLVGHYPFFDTSPQNLFSKVRSGYYQVPEHVSEMARSLISCLLAYEPTKRVPAWAVLEHPWFKHAADENFTAVMAANMPLLNLKDQTVPTV